jgi:bacillithiol biosynthesis cysteine-adding enzyme BshC
VKDQYVSENLETPLLVEELLNENTFTITTGHQLALFGGPKYFIHKIVSIIKLASDLSARYSDKKILPVFWLASEDHDYDEINSLNQFGEKISSKNEATGPVGRLPNTIFSVALAELKDLLGTSTDALKLIKTFEEAFQTKNWTAATRYWVQALFGDQLIIIDGDDRQLKAMYSHKVKDELLKLSSFSNIMATNDKLKRLDYHIQVEPRNINLFYIEDGLRERIVKTEKGFAVLNTVITFTQDEMLQLLKDEPEKISPNAILRPLYEESILPNLAYIGGPGELAYWLQLKANFDYHQTAFPLLVLRDSFTWLKKADKELLDSYQLNFTDLGIREDDLIKKFIELNGQPVINYSEEKEQLQNLFDALETKTNQLIKNHDPMVEAEKTRVDKFIKKLETRVYRDTKTREEVGIERILKLRAIYFPKGKLNERTQGFFDDVFVAGLENYIPSLLSASDALNPELKVMIYD